ncbi:uncharacterized protein LOC112453113 [Temnothorax curvispinosus]|uniref:Uncharacterized protein LOC112453113 n=1 Tax=Temnothorax curvispinosus TaxID=300111 RepID=A0A6J1PIN5_9HYME|nr:uncharacterized protein LOC112453113 [Temnothorax curvispinosus]
MVIEIWHSLVTIAMKFVYVILVFISLASAELEILNIIDNVNSDTNINNVVDEFIPQISQFIVNNNLDPLNLPQTKTKLWMDLSDTTISNQVEPMIYKADLILHSGILKRLSDLKRYGNATLSYKAEDVKLNLGFEFKVLQGSYSFTVNLVFFNLKGRILASSANVRAKTAVRFNSMNQTLSLDKFELQVPGKIKVIIENKNGLVDWVNTFIVNIITPFFKNTIVNFVQEQATNAIQTYFNEINKSLKASWLLSKITNMESVLNKN